MEMTGSAIFMESLGSEAKPFRDYVDAVNNIKKLFLNNPQWQSQAKGSVRQYLQYFPSDGYLREWEKLL
jgi:hypothetical protein